MSEKKNGFFILNILISRASAWLSVSSGHCPAQNNDHGGQPMSARGKPAPDPFLLAAGCLGYCASRCVVFEDSPSGIKAGVAAGVIVVAVCTSHFRGQIEDCGAHFVVEIMEDVLCEEIETDEGTRLMSTVEH